MLAYHRYHLISYHIVSYICHIVKLTRVCHARFTGSSARVRRNSGGSSGSATRRTSGGGLAAASAPAVDQTPMQTTPTGAGTGSQAISPPDEATFRSPLSPTQHAAGAPPPPPPPFLSWMPLSYVWGIQVEYTELVSAGESMKRKSSGAVPGGVVDGTATTQPKKHRAGDETPVRRPLFCLTLFAACQTFQTTCQTLSNLSESKLESEGI
eukprot:COSAG05_NODE_2842_length_2581_cov_1.939968_4_plen_210_part_00